MVVGIRTRRQGDEDEYDRLAQYERLADLFDENEDSEDAEEAEEDASDEEE